MERDNVLIIEDKKEDLMFLQQLLQKEGYKVWSCSNGPGGIKLARTTPFSAVLTELRMADMNGVEITKELLSINPMTGVVVMTVFSFVSSAVEAMEKGAYGYISKPFNSAEVSIVVARAIERSRLLGTSQSKDHYVELSAKDGLTGVYNRRFLDTFLTKKIVDARELKDEFAVLMIDLDHFKEYNDTKGHAAGDELLKSVAKVFQEAADVSGLIMTKLDGTAKGGVLVAIAEKFDLPIHAIGVGETIDDLQSFDADDFSKMLVGLK